MVAGKGNSHVKEAADGYLGVPPFSTAPMARNTENLRFSRMAIGKGIMHLQTRRFSLICGGFPPISASEREN